MIYLVFHHGSKVLSNPESSLYIAEFLVDLIQDSKLSGQQQLAVIRQYVDSDRCIDLIQTALAYVEFKIAKAIYRTLDQIPPEIERTMGREDELIRDYVTDGQPVVFVDNIARLLV